MSITHILARIALYSAGWFLTATTFINLFRWAEKQRTNQKVDCRFEGVVVATFIWAVLLGIIYW